MVEEGKKAPAFTLPNQDGEKVSLEDFRGKNLILYFYPKDNTSGCTKEAVAFNEHLDELKKLNTEVVGVSKDSIASHVKFIEKQGLNFTLLSDTELGMLEKYGVWQEKKMAGRTYMGIVRTTLIIDEEGRVRKIYPKVRVKGHVEKVIEDLKEIVG